MKEQHPMNLVRYLVHINWAKDDYQAMQWILGGIIWVRGLPALNFDYEPRARDHITLRGKGPRKAHWVPAGAQDG